MDDLVRVIADACLTFETRGLTFAIMGGIAVRAYGIPRATYDVDVVVAAPRTELPALFAAIRERGYTVPEVYDSGWVDTVAGMPLVKFRLYLQGRGIDIDVFLAESQFLKSVLSRRRREMVDDLGVWLVSPEDLILLKLIASRPRDIADVGDVLFTSGQLDEPYMREWADRLGIRNRLDHALAGQDGI
jgi:hypothetical protein